MPELHLGPAMYTILGVATLLKLVIPNMHFRLLFSVAALVPADAVSCNTAHEHTPCTCVTCSTLPFFKIEQSLSYPSPLHEPGAVCVSYTIDLGAGAVLLLCCLTQQALDRRSCDQ